MRTVLADRGYRVALGDCYSADPQVHAEASPCLLPEPSPSPCRRAVEEFHTHLLTDCAQGGSIVILHSPEPGVRHKTLAIVPRLVRDLRAKGLVFTTLTELFPHR
jgi:peptidoglycan/xylan/chitin deacetylase (PgdA/CDA1 family)